MQPTRALAASMVVLLACGVVACRKTATRKVSFTLYHRQNSSAPRQPEANQEIAVFPVENGRIRMSDNNRLGLGRTDSDGHASIEVRRSPQYSQYVLVLRMKNGGYMMIRHEGDALSFRCDDSQSACDLGDLVFETVEIHVGGG